MSEQTVPTESTETSGTGPATEAPETTDQGKTFTQSELDRIIGDRLARESAKYADYDQLKEAAAELEKIRDGEKTDLQRLQDELAAEREARTQAETTAAAVKRTQYGMDKGLPRDLAELLTAADDEGLDAQIEKLLPHVAPKSPEPRITGGGLRSGVTGSGGSTADPKERTANAVRELFDR